MFFDALQSLSIQTDTDLSGSYVTIVSRQGEEFTHPFLQFDHQNQNIRDDSTAVVAGSVHRVQLPSDLKGLYLSGNLSSDDVFYANAGNLLNDELPALMLQLPFIQESGQPISLWNNLSLRPRERVNIRFGQDRLGGNRHYE